MADSGKKLPSTLASDGEVDAFLRKIAATPVVRAGGRRGRLIFAMDATASRQPTWDRACHIQSEMFEATAALGGLDIQLTYFRGFRECKASSWIGTAVELQRRMSKVSCQAGHTQICRVLTHALNETRKSRVDAVVFVGDCMEEDIDELCHRAGELGVLGVPVFLFQERSDPIAKRAFQEVARLTRGAYCRFDLSSARQLQDLLAAVAVYAAGGRAALEDFGRRRGGETVRLLTAQVGGA
ncbi:MAG: VWA domain-containing protein [Azospirillum sp.]|nr:VWA domain-containing protein [Azospirillum sp.]